MGPVFLVAMRDTARKGVETFRKIVDMRQDVQVRIQGLGARTHNGLRLLEELYVRPILTGPQIEKLLGISRPTANTLLSLIHI